MKMRCWHPYSGLILLLSLGLSVTATAQSGTYHADPSRLPKIDPTKSFDTKSFGGFDREYQIRSIEFEAAKLPSFDAKINSIPLTDFQVSKPDVYTRALPTRDFENTPPSKVETTAAVLKTEGPFTATNSTLSSRQAKVPAEPIQTETLPTPPPIMEEELKDLINQGVTAGQVRLGKGYSGKELRPSKETPIVKVKSEKKSPPTSAPSR